ncbi:MAG TPA: hypothetical protein VHL09_07795 [Dehalococcoidia bacterium]|nr:hypothetical protein [Dehalococcoidia bacterium]
MSRAGRIHPTEPVYEVVWPLGRTTIDAVDPNPPILDLNGKTIGELWDWLFKGDQMYALLRDQLQRRFPEVRFVDFREFGNIHGQNEKEVIAALPDLLRRHGCDAVITSVGA